METLRKFPNLYKIFWARREITDISLSNVEPVRITVASKGPENITVRESGSLACVKVFTVEDEIHRSTPQNERLSIADDVFGDISSFLQSNYGDHEQLTSTVETTSDDNGLALIVGADPSLLAPESGGNEDQDIKEMPHFSENIVLADQQSVQIHTREVSLNTGTHSSNTTLKYKPSVYIHTQFDMMYIFGTCAYRTIIRNSTDGCRNSMHWGVSGFQLVIKII